MIQTARSVLVADSHSMSRAGLAAMFAGELGIAKVLETGDFASALASAACVPRVGLIVVDLELPGMQGSEGLRRLRLEHPGVLVVVLGARRDRDLVLSALSAGVHGYVPKDMSRDEMRAVFSSVLSGQIYVPPLVSDLAAQPPRPAAVTGTAADSALTERQRDVLRLLAAGRSNKEIARALRIAEGTVKVHIAAAFRILGVHNRVGAAAALREWEASERGERQDPDAEGREEQRPAGNGAPAEARRLRVITG